MTASFAISCNSTGQPDDLQELKIIEKSLRDDAEKLVRQSIAALTDVLACTSRPALDDQKTLATLQEVLSGMMNQRPAAITAVFEDLRPLARSYQRAAFSEALVRLSDRRGTNVCPHDIFKAITHPLVADGLAAGVRLWLTASAIIDFYSTHSRRDLMSLNMNAGDSERADFQSSMITITDALRRQNFPASVIEATETTPWTKRSLSFLFDMNARGHPVALDDYAAPTGHINKETLAVISKAPARMAPVYIKIDGEVIRNFIDEGNTALITHLQDIRRLRPDALIVAEWISSAEDARKMMDALKTHGLENAIHLVQGRDIKETSDRFLQKLLSSTPHP